MKAKKPAPKAAKDDETKKPKGRPAQSSIQVGPTTINTVAGPISEWLCIPENLPKNPSMAFFGKRRTGKSTTITNIACHCMKDIPFGLVMSDTAYAGYWEQIVPKKFIVQGLRQDVLEWLVTRQRTLISKFGGVNGMSDKQKEMVRAFIILDDV